MAFFLQKRVIKFGHTVAYFQTPPFMFSTSEMGIQLLNQGSHDRSTVNPFLIHCYVLRLFISSSSEPSDMADLCKHETISRAQVECLWSKTNLFEAVAQVALHRCWKGSSEVSPRQHVHFMLFSLWPHMVLAQGDLPKIEHQTLQQVLASSRPPQNPGIQILCHICHVNICQHMSTMCHAASIHGIHGSRRVPQRCVPLPLQLWVFCAQDSLQAPRCRWQNWKQKTTVVHHGATLLALRCGNCHIIHYQQRYQQGNMFKDICVWKSGTQKQPQLINILLLKSPIEMAMAIIWDFIQPLSSELPPLFPCQAS